MSFDSSKDDEELSPAETPPGPSELAEKLNRLKKAALTAADRRERIPVPLYWSLFHSQVREVRKVKARERMIRTLLISGS